MAQSSDAPHQIDDELVRNYRALKDERGCTWEQLAAEHETHDRGLAAFFRSQAAPDKPKGRSAPKKN